MKLREKYGSKNSIKPIKSIITEEKTQIST